LGTEKVSDLIFGIHPVLEALRSGKKLERLYISRGRKGKTLSEILHLAKSQGVEVRFEPWERLTSRLKKQNKFRTLEQDKFCTPEGKIASHQGVIGFMAAYSYVAFEDLISKTQEHNEPPFLMLLDQIQDPHNLGAILRSAECAGVHGVIITKDKSVSVTSTVVKVSAGATEYIPVCRVTNLVSIIEELKKNGIWVVGTSGAAQQCYTAVDFTMPIAIVIGNEEKGIRRLVAEKCDLLVSIPLYGQISSLNASVSSAIVMFEVRRQRNIHNQYNSEKSVTTSD
jgi:23S rRNA (guanosine2251-2'-O)-methyltransferase